MTTARNRVVLASAAVLVPWATAAKTRSWTWCGLAPVCSAPHRSPELAEPAGPHHRGRVRSAEAVVPVDTVSVVGEQDPAEVRPGAVVDHRGDEPVAEALPAVALVDVDIGEVGDPHSVRDRSGEPDLLARRLDIDTAHPPRALDLAFDVRAGSPAPPVRPGG